MSDPRLLLVESGDEALPIAKLLPSTTDKGFKALIAGRLRSIRRLRDRAVLVECETSKLSDLLLKSQKK